MKLASLLNPKMYWKELIMVCLLGFVQDIVIEPWLALLKLQNNCLVVSIPFPMHWVLVWAPSYCSICRGLTGFLAKPCTCQGSDLTHCLVYALQLLLLLTSSLSCVSIANRKVFGAWLCRSLCFLAGSSPLWAVMHKPSETAPACGIGAALKAEKSDGLVVS